ncbi:class I SAM-dependent DNA methyltransferase [Halothermothrix orenii]|uniref:Methyltransferase type 11 n=1 Tax=Halothermothrix orenii (strain H 168 / OCM 544 / DSM 9562) TaxID=373903 RepID=B8CY69_HALOH|nr:class I SAM-dependent methyltransferase [Halothermothrix orenii]ACL70238.1 Methyltransferase type 11 [Halothermothrix orenii H 168]
MDKAYTKSFARIYDDVMDAVPYNLWYDYIHQLLEYYQKTPTRVLELACGTGNMALRFARNGYLVTALDKSEAMLEVARNKARKDGIYIDFIKSDVRDFSFNEEFDLVFCLFDSLNYILSLQELKKVFENVNQVLSGDGLFIFDMNTIARLMAIKPGTSIIHGRDYKCTWQDIIDEDKKRWKVKLTIYFEGPDDNRDKPYKEIHEETSFKVSEVTGTLKGAGFKAVEVFNAYTFEKGTDSDNRIYYIASREDFKKKPLTKFKWKLVKFFSGYPVESG